MVKCRIIYNDLTESGKSNITIEYLPGDANFSTWMHRKIKDGRWKQTGNGIWLACSDATLEEAEYVERIAKEYFVTSGYEVIGRPKMHFEKYNPQPAPQQVKELEKADKPVEEYGQLSFF